MSAYFIASYAIVDQEKYDEYTAAVLPGLMKHSAEPVVVAHGLEASEGTAPQTYIVLKFASEEAARGWYDDPDYQPLKAIRLAATENGTAVIAPGFVMPQS